MARTVKDATITFSLLIGHDPEDPVTEEAVRLDGVDWMSLLDTAALEGVRLGVARAIFEREASTERMSLFDIALKELEAAGAIIIDDIDLGTMENDLGYNVLLYEFKAALNAYLGKTPAANPIRTLSDVIRFNNEHAEETLKFGQVMLEKWSGQAER